jgi:hypothetical protein
MVRMDNFDRPAKHGLAEIMRRQLCGKHGTEASAIGIRAGFIRQHADPHGAPLRFGIRGYGKTGTGKREGATGE